MYFESNRSSDEGMLAVGTVVMNRFESGRYPHTVCGVVGQRGQFAPGVLTLPMRPDEAARVRRVADAVLAGARHPSVGKAMFFHTAGLTFPYSNMHYVLVAGGNAFYEKVPGVYAERRSRPHTIGNMFARLFSGIARL
jgi:spore germination cell wall hydrolase CwlJ-like protein